MSKPTFWKDFIRIATGNVLLVGVAIYGIFTDNALVAVLASLVLFTVSTFEAFVVLALERAAYWTGRQSMARELLKDINGSNARSESERKASR